MRTKLRAAERRAGDHRVFEIFDDDDRLVATTALSRSWRGATTIAPNMVSTIGRELGLQGHPGAIRRLVACPLTRGAYLAIVHAPDVD